MHTYQNEKDVDIAVIGVGVIKAGAQIQSPVLIESPGLKLIGSDMQDRELENQPEDTTPQATGPIVGIEKAQDGAVTDATPVETDDKEDE